MRSGNSATNFRNVNTNGNANNNNASNTNNWLRPDLAETDIFGSKPAKGGSSLIQSTNAEPLRGGGYLHGVYL